MIQRFLHFIEQEDLVNGRVLLAVSGGVDSVVMARLFSLTQFEVGFAHCNFRLRNDESDRDASFVKELAEELKVDIHSKEFNTNEYSAEKGIPIQMAARELRFSWFEEVCTKYHYTHIAIASHRNDEIETLLMNLTKGTGIAGLHGILPQRGKVIHPLMFATKEEILNYANDNKIDYRADASNNETKYLRNKIRHQVIPVLKDINPNLENTFRQNITHFRNAEKIVQHYIETQRHKLIEENEGRIEIDINKLRSSPFQETLLYGSLSEFGFNATHIQDLLSLLDGNSGKQIYSETHYALKDREKIIVYPLLDKDEGIAVVYQEDQTTKTPILLKLSTKKNNGSIPTSACIAALDYGKLSFPLIIRKWQNGDSFQPLGMDNKKKVSDLLIDEKVPLDKKNQVHVLTSNNEIVWVIGHRIDHRYRIVETTEKIYLAELIDH